ncbi:MAG TPA: hypothetical protein VE077_17645 [Candidatus Methylomirabilis sp.]|nr:hypothetical protein [Candidatus Methylomirabilis sp.]
MGYTDQTPPDPNGPQPTAIQTIPPEISFLQNNVPPANFLFFHKDDSLAWGLLSNVAGMSVRMQYRYLTPKGEIKEGQLIILTIVGNQANAFSIGEGWLMSVGFQIIAGNSAGAWAYIQLAVSHNFNTGVFFSDHGLLWSGYVSGVGAAGWPGTAPKEPTDGAGFLRSITGTIPGAGADLSESVPANRRWILPMFTASLVTSAAVANRGVAFTIDDGVNILYAVGVPTVQTASSTVRYLLTSTGVRSTAAETDQLVPIPNLTSLKNGYRIKSVTANLQAGDQWSAPQYLAIEWGTWET